MHEVWGPLYDNVDYVFSGHSHLWMKTKSGVRVDKAGPHSGGRARFSVVGPGGFEMDSRYAFNNHELIEELDAQHFVFALYYYN